MDRSARTLIRRLDGLLDRVRRRLREIVRLHPDALCEGYDHVVIAFSSAAPASYATLQDELICLLERARAWVSDRASSSR